MKIARGYWITHYPRMKEVLEVEVSGEKSEGAQILLSLLGRMKIWKVISLVKVKGLEEQERANQD